MQYTIDSAPPLSLERDIPFLKVTSLGIFSVKSAWDSTRRRGRLNHVADVAWGTLMPTQIKLLIWCLLKAIIPVELVVKLHDYELASWCV